MVTKLIKGEEVLEFINTAEFIKKWKLLAHKSHGFTTLQEPEFVINWYLLYSTEYLPLLSVLLDHELVPHALMCLGYEKKTQMLTHVGHHCAEYHGWLAIPGEETDFIFDTFQLIQQELSLKHWEWNSLSPGLSQKVFSNLSKIGVFVVFKKRPSLLWNLNKPEKLQKFKRNRSIKSKFNRYQKRGNLEFRIITDEQETVKILNEVQYQCDFRQEAINGARPFADNPQKIKFWASRQRTLNTTHASGLWLDDRLLAFHIGACDKQRVCLGTTSYDPTESKNSPGTLLMVKLAEALTEEGFEIFDLTPGKDPYKLRFANDQQESYQPIFYFTAASRFKGIIRHIIFEGISKVMSVLKLEYTSLKKGYNALVDLKTKVKNIGFIRAIKGFLKAGFYKKQLFIYRFNIDSEKTTDIKLQEVNQQRYRDLLSYTRHSPWSTRKALLSYSLSKFSKGEILFSSTKNEELNWLCWLTDSDNPLLVRGLSSKIELKGGQRILYDFYSDDKLNSISFIQHLRQSLALLQKKDCESVLVILDSQIKSAENGSELLKLAQLRSIICFRILWAFTFKREINTI